VDVFVLVVVVAPVIVATLVNGNDIVNLNLCPVCFVTYVPGSNLACSLTASITGHGIDPVYERGHDHGGDHDHVHVNVHVTVLSVRSKAA
jgi:hypothetical protein